MPKPPPPDGPTPLTPHVVITSPSDGTPFNGGSHPDTIVVTGTVFLTCDDPGGDCAAGNISRVTVQLGGSTPQQATLNLDSIPAGGTEESGSWSFTGAPPPGALGDLSITATLTALTGVKPHQHVETAEASITVFFQPHPPPNSALVSVAGYYTPDGFRHAIVAKTNGDLHEIFFSPQSGIGVDRLACFDTIDHLDGFFTSDDGYQHEIVATPDGDIHEIFFKPNDIRFTEPPIARFNGIVDIAAFYAEDDQNRIVIVATDNGDITEIFYNPSTGIHITQPPIASFADMVGIAAFYTPDDHFRHVIVATADGNLTEIFYHPSIGVHISQPPLARFTGIVGIAAFYTPDDHFRHVIVATADGNLTEIFYHPSIGVHISQPPLARFDTLVDVAAFYTPDDQYRHVIVAAHDGSVTEIFYHPSIGVHISQPPLARFSGPSPALEDISPDPNDLDPNSLARMNAGFNSTAGRAVSVSGDSSVLYAFSQRAGIWKSVADNRWVQLTDSPLEAQLFGPSAIAVDPNSSVHLVAGNAEGLWETTDQGSTWNLVLDPTSQAWNCASSTIRAVAFGPDSTLFAGVDCGVVRRLTGGSFQLAPVNGAVTALAISQSKVWARTLGSILLSTDNGVHWSAPIAAPADVSFGGRGNQGFTLAAFDDFAYMTFSTAGDTSCGATNWMLIFNAASQQWSRQRVDFQGKPTCDGTGLGGRKFVKSFIRKDAALPMGVGQRLQLFYSAGQELFQALGTNGDGTVSQWAEIVTTVESGGATSNSIHADIWDMHIDVSVGGGTVWVAGDGGIYVNTLASPYNFPGSGWSPLAGGMHTHEINTVTALPVSPIARSRISYACGDNDFWYRSSTPVVMPDPQWHSGDGFLGDGSWTVGDAAAPGFALAARHQTNAVLIRYDASPEMVNCALGNASTVVPDVPTRFEFIPSPPTTGHVSNVDAVMMLDLPVLVFDPAQNKFVPLDPGTPLGQNTHGAPVLIRNQNFDANPDMNTGKGAGWQIEIASLPPAATGFYVTGIPRGSAVLCLHRGWGIVPQGW